MSTDSKRGKYVPPHQRPGFVMKSGSTRFARPAHQKYSKYSQRMHLQKKKVVVAGPRQTAGYLVHCGDQILMVVQTNAAYVGKKNKYGKVLPMDRYLMKWYGLPKGGLKEKETTEEAAARELREETGLVLTPEEKKSALCVTVNRNCTIYVVTLDREKIPEVSVQPTEEKKEIDQVVWMSVSDAFTLTTGAKTAEPTTANSVTVSCLKNRRVRKKITQKTVTDMFEDLSLV